MKKISIWAKAHKGPARTIIVLLHFALILLGIETGRLLVKSNFHINPLAFWMVLLVYILAFFVYPQRGGSWSSKSRNKIYIIQKSCDFVLVFCGFLLISFLSSYLYTADAFRISLSIVNPVYSSNGAKPTAAEILQSLQYRSRKDLSRSEKKVLKHEFIKQVKVYVSEKAQGHDQIALKAFLIICTLAAAVGIGYLVAGLACALSCSGAEGLALLVAIAGLAGIIFGSVKLIRAISRIKKKQPEAVSP